MKSMAKKIFLAAMAAGAIFALASCQVSTTDYDYGTAFLAIDWSPSWGFYADFDNTDLPDTVTRNVSYEHNRGSYSFTYYLYDSYENTYTQTYLVEYTITANRGEAASYIADKNFILYCGWNGILETGFSIRGSVVVEADGSMVNEQTIGETSLRAVYRVVDSPRSKNILQVQK